MANLLDIIPNDKKPNSYLTKVPTAAPAAPVKSIPAKIGQDNPGLPPGQVYSVPKMGLGDFLKGLPGAAATVGNAIGNFVAPSTTAFVKDVTRIFSEGGAMILSKDVRDAYQMSMEVSPIRKGESSDAYNKRIQQEMIDKQALNVLPTITHSDLKSQVTQLGKEAAGTVLEATILKVLPPSLSLSLKARFGVGALQGVGYAVSEGLAHNYSVEQIVKNIPQYAVFGAAGEAVAPYVGKLLSTDLKAAPEAIGNAARGLSKEAEQAGISAGMSIKDVSGGLIPGEKVVWEGRPYEVKLANEKNVRITDKSGFEAVVPHSELRPMPEATTEVIKKEIDDLKLQVGQAQEAITTNPASQLSKYQSFKYSSTGGLPEVTGERGGGVYKQRGDQIAQEMGFNDIQHAEAEYEKLVKQRDNLKQLQSQLTDKKELLKATLVKNKGAAEAVDTYNRMKGKADVPIVDSTEMKYIEAQVESTAGDFKKKGFASLAPELKTAFQDYVNGRHASELEGYAKKLEFKNLDQKGMQGIFDFQAGKEDPQFADLRKYFNLKARELTDAGIPINYEQNYAPQIWKNPAEEVNQIMGRKLGNRPTFTFDKVIEDYKKGIELGLTPKFNSLSELAQWYEYNANKAIADKKFMNFMIDKHFIAPQSSAPLGWKIVDPTYFPLKKIQFPNGTEYVGAFAAPPELADVLNNYLRPGWEPLAKVANIISGMKNIVLSSGIPKTGLNAHGFNILYRSTIADANPVSGFMRGAYYLLRPAVAHEALLADMKAATYAVKNGLMITAEDHAMADLEDSILSKAFGNLKQFQYKYFEKPLFNDVLPALKVQRWNVVFDELKKSFPQDEAAKKAAEITNNIFGGINFDALGRDKNLQNLLRSVILAPDWAETNFKNIPKGIFTKGPVGKQYQVMARNLLMTYIAANVTNYGTAGHFMFQNAPGHEFQIELGKSVTGSGKTRYIKFAGTAADFVRIPHDIALSLAKGDLSVLGRTIRNRLSIPLGAASSVVFNTDYTGRPILGKDKYGNPIPLKEQVGGVAGQISDLFLPQYGQAAIDGITGRSDWEQALSQALELPTAYGSAPRRKKKSTKGGL